jgi:DNA-binding transcriptional MerR regulator
LKINDVAKLTGVTVRTLHYYDEIGLLKPEEVNQSGYRIYTEKSLERLQQILFFRELDFPLEEIKGLMEDPLYDEKLAMRSHMELLIKKRERLDRIIGLLNNKIEGDEKMSFKEFDSTEIQAVKEKYAQEVKERWGSTDAYKESHEKTKGYDENQWKDVLGKGGSILQEFADCRECSPDSQEAQKLVGKWQDYITDNFYTCTREILSCLGMMYIGDERFTENIDRHGKGTAEFMAKAIEIYCRG